MSVSSQYPSSADIEEAATIAPPLSSDPSLTIFHSAMSNYVVEQKATQTASWQEFHQRHYDMDRFTSQARFRVVQANAMKKFYEGYTQLLYSLVRGRSRELRNAMQAQIDRYSSEVQLLDVWRYSVHLPMIVLIGPKDVERMAGAIEQKFPGRFVGKKRDTSTSSSSAPLPPVATDSNADRAPRLRSRRHI
ncbi:hypothetical protein EVG20_g7268 [Dentipellis fragilis]|uniref:Uncharacterized protein n=1 Tax=Dentipellis fragilis TaxID=205917 RepID=A0A4Y9YIR8_9AGAM|nr:hypothetical protein EVG20_g7268 [Dentipellis fragilis]